MLVLWSGLAWASIYDRCQFTNTRGGILVAKSCFVPEAYSLFLSFSHTFPQARHPRTNCHQEQGNRRPTPRNTQGEQRHPKAPRLHSCRQHQEQTSRPGNFRSRWRALDTSRSMCRRRRSRVDRYQGAGDHHSERLQATTKQTGTSLAARSLSPCHVCRRLQLLAHRLGIQDHQPRWRVPGRMVLLRRHCASVRPKGAPFIYLRALEHRDQPRPGLRQNHRVRVTPCTAHPGQVPLLPASPITDHNTIAHPVDKGKTSLDLELPQGQLDGLRCRCQQCSRSPASPHCL